jgi:ABC-type transport system involved in cytochrome bd biosynthesis fused ATPase/permease subunit
MGQDGSESRAETRKNLTRTLRHVAPKIAETLGGPLAGAAVGVLARALFGTESASEEELARALSSASAEQLIALKRAENEFRLALRQAAVEETRVAAADRASARARQRDLRDWTPSILGALIIGGFFLTLAAMVARRLPAGAETEFSIMLGALATMTAAVVNYFFGSSAGSREKTMLLSGVKKAED